MPTTNKNTKKKPNNKNSQGSTKNLPAPQKPSSKSLPKPVSNDIELPKLKSFTPKKTTSNKPKTSNKKTTPEVFLPKLKNQTPETKPAKTQTTKLQTPKSVTAPLPTPKVEPIAEKKTKNVLFYLIPLIIFGVTLTSITIFFKVSKNTYYNNAQIKNITVIAYDLTENTMQLAIEPTSEQSYCALDNNDTATYVELTENKCLVTTTIEPHKLYFKDPTGFVSQELSINDLVLDIDLTPINYLALDTTIDLSSKIIKMGNPKITLKSSSATLKIEDLKITATNSDKATLDILVNDQLYKSYQFTLTNVIVQMPTEFDYQKPYLDCEQFTHEEASLLDEILEYRIASAGYATRAGAVAAARFLTLEFPYRISYYWETGRLNNTGKHYVDGEGRYYHKGLYLDSSKYDTIEASFYGPQMWGCKMISWEDDLPYFKMGKKYPNGLDCSGFVSWALYNAGFDVGDRGAGESPSDGQLTDLAEFLPLTDDLIASGRIRVGDLFNYWGHISILIGEDEKNYYIAESLNALYGLVAKKYPKNKVIDTFKYVVLMDEVYAEDGNLTNLWY